MVSLARSQRRFSVVHFPPARSLPLQRAELEIYSRGVAGHDAAHPEKRLFVQDGLELLPVLRPACVGLLDRQRLYLAGEALEVLYARAEAGFERRAICRLEHMALGQLQQGRIQPEDVGPGLLDIQRGVFDAFQDRMEGLGGREAQARKGQNAAPAPNASIYTASFCQSTWRVTLGSWATMRSWTET